MLVLGATCICELWLSCTCIVYHSIHVHVYTHCAFRSHIATMLKSHDCHMVVGGVQMAHILMEKLPDIFLIYFYREGVVHEVKLLRDGPFKLLATPQKQDKTPPLLDSTPCQLPPTTSSVIVQTTPPGPSHTHTSTRRHVF